MKFFATFILFICAVQIQAQGFAITSAKRILGSGNLESNITAKLPSLSKIKTKAIDITFKKLNSDNTASNVSIIVMDDARQEIGERITVDNYTGGKIVLPLSIAMRSSKSRLSIYILRMPTDPNVAATVRMAPVLMASFK